MGLLRSYLEYARGKKAHFLWKCLNPSHFLARFYVNLRNAAYDRGILESVEPPLPVISIGNLCHGGTNKTPTVEYFAKRFMDSGLDVGIISRGYGGASKEPLFVGEDEQSRNRTVTGDEPLLLADRLPNAKIVVSADRMRGISLLAELGAQIVVADDAFQHRRMGRDVDIVLVDATCPLGNGLMMPAGILRDPPESLKRADFVILTKVDQVASDELDETQRLITQWVPVEKLFTARLKLDSWCLIDDDERSLHETQPKAKLFAFSAIGNPDSFHRSLELMGVTVVGSRVYRDHHPFSPKDLKELTAEALQSGAEAFVCTEKDLHNLPENVSLALPVWVPRISVGLDEEGRLWRGVIEKLRPHCVVASNGYGEDAIGAVLAQQLQERLPLAKVSAFSLVGDGKQYVEKGIEVVSPFSEMPSAGLIKYSLKALIKDVQHGLRKNISDQIKRWRSLRGKIRTPLCVGDVYLVLHSLWGQGASTLLIATAKTVHLSGHWPIERFLLKHRCIAVWARDEETATELQRSGVKAFFSGNPIMDLITDPTQEDRSPWGNEGTRVLLLPGSRPRAYNDICLLLDAAEELNKRIACQFILVPAPTLKVAQLVSKLEGWLWRGDVLEKGTLRIVLHGGTLASAAKEAQILLGLAGTANQVCAGLGVPVVSIKEKGKYVQKKLLQDAEILVDATPLDLAEAAEKILKNPKVHGAMRQFGINRLGGVGALADALQYAEDKMGWRTRHDVYHYLTVSSKTDVPKAVNSAIAGVEN